MHRVSDIAGSVSIHGLLYALVEGSLRDIKELSGLRIYLPDREGVAGVAIVTFVQGSYVTGDYVSLLEDVVGRESVHDYVIHRGAYCCRKSFKTQEAWNRSVVTDESLRHPIQLFSCHTWGNGLADFGQCLGHQYSVLSK